MQLKVLHVFRDDKFFDTVSKSFESVSGIVNEYAFFTSKESYKFKFIKDYSKIKIEIDENKYMSLFTRKDINVIFFHALPKNFYQYVLIADSHKKIIWWSWGYDIYFTGLINTKMYMPLTNELISHNEKSKLNIRSFLRRLLHCRSVIKERIIQRKAISRIDYSVTVLPIEFDLLKKKSYFSAKRFMERGIFTFYDTKRLAKNPPNVGNILLGNSATYENNHLDVMEILNNLDVGNERKIIIPLNYGIKEYSNLIKQNLDSKYISLDSFLEKNEYEKIIDSCSHAIFGSLRQQALGNIHMCFYRGIKVFLYKESLTYIQLKKDGYLLYSIDDELNEVELSTPMTSDQMIHNQEILKRINLKNGINGLQRAFDDIRLNSNYTRRKN